MTIKFVPNKYSRRIAYSFAKKHMVCIYDGNDASVFIVAVNHINLAIVLSELKRKLQLLIKVTLTTPNQFNEILSAAYSDYNAAAIVDNLQDDISLSDLLKNLPRSADLLESDNNAPVIKIINAFLTQAIREGASDIHLDAYEKNSLVRFRTDGTLHDIVEINPGIHAALVSRIKIMSQLDIAEKRLPQDGRISIIVAGREVDMRVSIIPTGHGERIVLRLLDKNKDRLQLEVLGMNDSVLQQVNTLIHKPNGILLVTGPTGSGKSTTLYAALAKLNSHELNIMTVEDPIEYDIAGLSQTQVNNKIDMTFARALRSILRQDPDVIMVGEIRDFDTASIAVQASLTGHLVFATLHTNSAAAAVTRLVDMGVEPFLLASTVIGILAQRLVRLLCNKCKKLVKMGNDIYQLFELPADTEIFSAVGCEACGFTGYKGRNGIHELLIIDNQLQKLIHNSSSDTEIEEYAISQLGMKTLRLDARRYLLDGLTSVEEIISVTRD